MPRRSTDACKLPICAFNRRKLARSGLHAKITWAGGRKPSYFQLKPPKIYAAC